MLKSPLSRPPADDGLSTLVTACSCVRLCAQEGRKGYIWSSQIKAD